MRCLNELSKQELIGLITHLHQDMDMKEKNIDCPVCADDDKAKYWTICDRCNAIPDDNELIKDIDFNKIVDADYCVCGREFHINKSCPVCDRDE